MSWVRFELSKSKYFLFLLNINFFFLLIFRLPPAPGVGRAALQPPRERDHPAAGGLAADPLHLDEQPRSRVPGEHAVTPKDLRGVPHASEEDPVGQPGAAVERGRVPQQRQVVRLDLLQMREELHEDLSESRRARQAPGIVAVRRDGEDQQPAHQPLDDRVHAVVEVLRDPHLEQGEVEKLIKRRS